MYTRSRQSQPYNNARPPNAPNIGYPVQNVYQQGCFPSGPGVATQQGNFKPGNAPNNQPFKPAQPQQPQPQQQQQQQMQMQHARPLQQMKPQQPMQQQQMLQQLQPQQPTKQQDPAPITISQPPRLKPILKQPSSAVQQQTVSPNLQSTAPSQPAPAPVPAPTSTSVPMVSVEKSTPIANSSSDSQIDAQESESMDIDQDQPKWRRKTLGVKNPTTTRMNKRLKRIRLNQRLRKTLQPKNAIMVLNEMKAGVQFTFPETQGTMSNSLYVVHAELGGKTYVGQGLSKPLARQNAAENALKALLLEKMTAATMKARLDAEGEAQQPPPEPPSDTSNSQQTDTTEDNNAMEVDDSNEIPWSSLASFALYKLFLEWHNQGTSVPVPRPGLPSPVKGIKREVITQKTPMQKELPPNATTIHPVMLLNQMRPGLTYVELHRVGNPPNTMFTLAVEIDGIEYTGTAKNKKDAKKIAAKAALLALYGLCYPDETRSAQDQVQGQEVQVL